MILYALRDGDTYRVGFVDIDLLNMDIGFVSIWYFVYMYVFWYKSVVKCIVLKELVMTLF